LGTGGTVFTSISLIRYLKNPRGIKYSKKSRTLSFEKIKKKKSKNDKKNHNITKIITKKITKKIKKNH